MHQAALLGQAVKDSKNYGWPSEKGPFTFTLPSLVIPQTINVKMVIFWCFQDSLSSYETGVNVGIRS
jgi:hypothetical protein